MSGAEVFGDPFAKYDAAYLLGALAPEDRQAFVEHLRTCADCSRSVNELAGLPGLLARVPADLLPDSAGAAEPPETLLPSLLDTVRRGTRRRRRWTAAGFAVAAAAAVFALVAIVTGPRPQAPVAASAPAVTLAPVTTTPIRATAQLQPVAWGTKIVLRCTYASGAPYGTETYSLVVLDRSGRTEQVATWNAVVGQESVVQGATSWTATDISALEVRTADGEPVLRMSSPRT